MADEPNKVVSAGGGPGAEWAQFVPHVLPVALFVAIVTTIVLTFLIRLWPQCEFCPCEGTPPCPDAAGSWRSSAAELPDATIPRAPARALELGDAGVLEATHAAIAAGAQAGNAEPPAPAFVVKQIGPTVGRLCGGEAVTIAGTGFGADTQVHFGGIPAAAVRVGKAGTSLVARSPEHWESAVDVTVSSGQSSTTLTKAFNYVCSDRTQSRLLILVVLAGILGGSLHSLRSLFHFAGNRTLRVSWLPMYLLLPFSGAAISTVFFLVFVAGFFSPQAGDGQSFFMMVGVSALVGMFSQQAVEKLKKISEAVLTSVPAAADRSDDSHPTPVTLTAIAPETGPVAGQVVITLTGSGFREGIKVFFGELAATDVTVKSNTQLTASIPAHAAGRVDVAVQNPDGGKATLPLRFEYG